VPHRAASTDTPIHEIKAELFKAMGHPLRIRLLELLAPGERPVSELLAETGLEASHLSQHLAVLRRTGLVTGHREGNTVRYRLAHPSVVDLLTAARTFLVDSLTGTNALLTGLAEPIAVPEDAAPAGEAQPSESTPPTQRTSTESSPRS
jgi:ArsR family transcriptional regulator